MTLIEIDEKCGLPIWVQIRNRIAYLIEAGYFKPGDQLPTIRALASELEINYHTCNKAYATLETDGYIVTKRGRGTLVSERHPGKSNDAADAIMDECIRRCLALGMALGEIGPRFEAALERASSKDED